MTAAETELPESATPRSCDPCRLRKIKCDRKEPCFQCSLRGIECVFSARKKRRRKCDGASDGPSQNSNATVPVESTSSSNVIVYPNQHQLGPIQYHLQQLYDLLEQGQSQKGLAIDSNCTGANGKMLLEKVYDQLKCIVSPSPQLKLWPALEYRDAGQHVGHYTPSSLNNSVFRDRAVFTRESGIIEKLHLNTHTPWLPCETDGLLLLDIFVPKVISFPIISIPLARVIRNTIYTPSFSSGKHYLELLTCASYMMLKALQFATPEIRSQKVNEIGIDDMLLRNVYLVIQDAHTLLTPSLLTIQALLIAAVCAKEVHDPVLCWTIVSAACRQCLDLGLHHETIDPITCDSMSFADAGMIYDTTTNPQGERLRLFWSCFSLDKIVSLSFGLSPAFQTKECAVLVPTWTQFTTTEPYSIGYGEYRKSIELAFLYDAIYTRLYSVSAESELGSLGVEGSIQRTCRRQEIVNSLHKEADLYFENTMIWIAGIQRSGIPSGDRLANVFRSEVEYTYGVCLSMIHRVHAGVSADSNDINIKASRKAMKTYRELIAKRHRDYKRSSNTLWAFVFHPLAPFFSIFSAIVANMSGLQLDQSDLEYLQLVRSDLELLTKHAKGNSMILRLTSLVRNYTRVAEEVVDNRKQQTRQNKPDLDATIGNEAFDASFLNLGMSPNVFSDAAIYAAAARQLRLPSWRVFLPDNASADDTLPNALWTKFIPPHQSRSNFWPSGQGQI
ncbi:hypothetical protein V1512DRAFT_261577 [Lipomyces arxii]|uniref:uncharacterized protein n=1 Tax=Lipomyces arxii TaxID=56418 RepID=UPI0034CEA254